MSSSKELEVVRTLSKIEIPKEMLGNTSVGNMLSGIVEAKERAKKGGNALDKARKEKEEGNLFGNWWHSRNASIRAAELDVAKSVGDLSAKSADLLILNTYLASVLNDQQSVLSQQQGKLDKQTLDLINQNAIIMKQQDMLASQQIEINKANEGLLKAKGVSSEQAKKLIGCVESVESAEINLKRYTVEQVGKVKFSQEALSERLTLEMHKNNNIIVDMINDAADDNERQIKDVKQGIEDQKMAHEANVRQLWNGIKLIQEELVNQLTSSINELDSKHQVYAQNVNHQLEMNKEDFYRNLNASITNVQKDTQALMEQADNKHLSDMNAVNQQIEKQKTAHEANVHELGGIIENLQNVLNQKIEDHQTKQQASALSLEDSMQKMQDDLHYKVNSGLNRVKETTKGLIDDVNATQQAQIKAVKEQIEMQAKVHNAQFIHREDYEKQISAYEKQVSVLEASAQKVRTQNYISLAVLACLICVLFLMQFKPF